MLLLVFDLCGVYTVERYCLMNRKDVTRKIKWAQKTLDKMHVNLNISKELRHRSQDVIFERLQSVLKRYGKRCNLLFLMDIVDEIIREVCFDSTIHLFVEKFAVDSGGEVIIPMYYLDTIPKENQSNIPIVVEINTMNAMYCISVIRHEKYYLLETDLYADNEYKHGYSFVYDTDTKDIYVMLNDVLKASITQIPNQVVLTINNVKCRTALIGNKATYITNVYKESDIYIGESVDVVVKSLHVLHDYFLTLKDMNTYKKPSTVEKHRSGREAHNVVVIERKETEGHNVRDIYVKMSDMIKTRTGHGKGTPHSSHAPPCEHTRRATKRHLKDGRVVSVRATVVNAGKGDKAVKTVIVDK